MGFTVTQFGLHVNLPIFDTGIGRYIALLGSQSSTQQNGPEALRVCLILEKTSTIFAGTPDGGQPSVYHCSLHEDSRCILISVKMVSKLKWKSRDIYISTRPPYREGGIDHRGILARLMVSSPRRPYHITPVAVAKWEKDWRIVLSSIQIPPLPWTGASAVILNFKSILRQRGTLGEEITIWTELVLGRCTEVRGRGKEHSGDYNTLQLHTPSPQPIALGSHYAVVRCTLYKPGSLTSDLFSGSMAPLPTHSCEHDHLDLTQIPTYPKWIDLPVKSKQCGGHTIQCRRRSPPSHAGMLLEVGFSRPDTDKCEYLEYL